MGDADPLSLCTEAQTLSGAEGTVYDSGTEAVEPPQTAEVLAKKQALKRQRHQMLMDIFKPSSPPPHNELSRPDSDFGDLQGRLNIIFDITNI